MRKTNGEPYTGRLVRTVRGQALGNLPSQDDKAPSAEPTILLSSEVIHVSAPFKKREDHCLVVSCPKIILMG